MKFDSGLQGIDQIIEAFRLNEIILLIEKRFKNQIHKVKFHKRIDKELKPPRRRIKSILSPDKLEKIQRKALDDWKSIDETTIEGQKLKLKLFNLICKINVTLGKPKISGLEDNITIAIRFKEKPEKWTCILEKDYQKINSNDILCENCSQSCQYTVISYQSGYGYVFCSDECMDSANKKYLRQ